MVAISSVVVIALAAVLASPTAAYYTGYNNYYSGYGLYNPSYSSQYAYQPSNGYGRSYDYPSYSSSYYNPSYGYNSGSYNNYSPYYSGYGYYGKRAAGFEEPRKEAGQLSQSLGLPQQ
ncbi:hypothetical protein AAVH_12890 [Aphelenchoides avenae]|nr:hypothetical protein AAVH_12890 [Aphelenchus avenae]